MSLELRHTIVGAPIAADADPNTTAPSADRIFSTPLRSGSWTGGPVTLYGLLADGTSCSFTVWAFSTQYAKWFQIGAATAVTALVMGSVTNIPSGADVFIQITAPVGDPTQFGVVAQ